MITIKVKIESDNKPSIVSIREMLKLSCISLFCSKLESEYKHEGYINPKITILEIEDNE